jgi:YesN/AraC family two-component response regulator
MSSLKEKIKLLLDKKILFVDNNESLVKSVAQTFRKLNIECLVAHNGKEGYDIYKNTKLDLIITEFDMPIVSGVDLIRLVQEECVDLPIIMLSGNREKTLIETACNLEVHTFLIKPLNYIELFDIITQINFK